MPNGTLAIYIFASISGGKGLIFRPILIFLGIPIPIIISSAIISGTFSRFIKIYSFNKYKKIDWKLSENYFLLASIGSIIGAVITVKLNEEILKIIIGIIILSIGSFLFFNKKLGLKEKKIYKKIGFKEKIIIYPTVFITSIFVIIVGGMGSIIAFILIKYHGKTYINASATNSVIGMSTIFASIYFIYISVIDWSLIITLIISSSVGTYYGVHYGIKKGEIWVKNLSLIVIFISGIKLIFF